MTMSLTKFERQTARAECAGSQCRPAALPFFDLSLRIGSKTRARRLLNTRETLESVSSCTRFSDFWRYLASVLTVWLCKIGIVGMLPCYLG